MEIAIGKKTRKMYQPNCQKSIGPICPTKLRSSTFQKAMINLNKAHEKKDAQKI
jgi:hypothetical protein